MPWTAILSAFWLIFMPSVTAYPIFAQKIYQSPREETGRIVCANCHLASKPISVEAPQSLLPAQVFPVQIKIPVEKGLQQVSSSGQKRPLNVRAIVVAPPNVRLAKSGELSTAQKKASKRAVFQQYNKANSNIFVARPIPANRPLTLFLVAPEKGPFRTHPIYVRRNRRRRQLYPDRQKSNNTVYTSPATGQVDSILTDLKGSFIRVKTKSDQIIEIEIPKRPELVVEKRQSILAEQPITKNPNVRGFRQFETEIVYQDPARLFSLQLFLWVVFIGQCSLVLKKKQIEQTVPILL